MKTRTGASSKPVWQRDFIPRLREGILHAGQRDCDAILDWMSKNTHVLPVQVSRKGDFMAERTVVVRNEFWYRNENLAPVQ